MFAVYLELAFKYLFGAWLGGLIIIVFLVGIVALGYTVIRVIIEDNKWDSDSDFDIDVFLINTIKTALKVTVIIVVILTAYDGVVAYTSREFAVEVQELKVKHGIEDYHLVITDGDGDVVFEKIGYFEYYKELNQVYVTDLITKKVEIFTIEDGMRMNINITNGGEK